MSALRVTTALVLALACASVACSREEEPARVELRARLRQEVQLAPEELDRLRTEVTRRLDEHDFLVREGDRMRPLEPQQRAEAFAMLAQPAGMFDEGLRREGDSSFRVLNAPGIAPSSEIDAARRLWIDVDTLLPRRFEFTYGFTHPENYTWELMPD